MKLREYQEDCLQAIEKSFTDHITRQMVVLPTGSGKTVIFSELIKRKNLKTLVIAHRIELLQQAKDKLNLVTPEIESGIFCGEQKELGKQVTIASIQSASSYLELLKKENYQLLIIDEAHHSAAKTYRNMIFELGFDRSGLMVGFTATPQRGDKTRLDDVFQKIVFHLDASKLIADGHLVQPYGIHVKVGIDLREIKKNMGEFDQESLKEAMQSNNAMQIVISAIKAFASKRHGIVFGVDIEHSENLMKAIESAGFSCTTVHSKVPSEERQRRLKAFTAGKVQFITNPMILTEGFDCPRADCMINASPTLNNSLYTQKAGRVLRPFLNKNDALLIDFGRNERKNELCTAKTLIGGDLPVRTVSSYEDLGIELSENVPPEYALLAEAKSYDPLKRQLSRSNSIHPKGNFEEAINYPSSWPIEERYISESQLKLIQKLSRSTKTPIPRKKTLEEMGIGFASRVIDYLFKKKKRIEESEPITEAQEKYLSLFMKEIDLGDKTIDRLTKTEAHRFIGRHRQSQRTHRAWN